MFIVRVKWVKNRRRILTFSAQNYHKYYLSFRYTMSEALTPHLSREQYRRGYLLNMGKKISNEAYNLSAVETYLSQGESAADAINDSATLTQGIPLATLKAINAVKYREVVENSTAAVQPLALREQQFIYAGSDGLTSLLRSMMQNGKKVPQYLFRQIINDVMSQASGTRPTAIDPLVQMAGVNSPIEEANADGEPQVPNTQVDLRVNDQTGNPTATQEDVRRAEQTDFNDANGNADDGSDSDDSGNVPRQLTPAEIADLRGYSSDDSQFDDMPSLQPLPQYESSEEEENDDEESDDSSVDTLDELAGPDDGTRMIYKRGPTENLTKKEKELLDAYYPEDQTTNKNLGQYNVEFKKEEPKKKKKDWTNLWGFSGEGVKGGRLIGRNSVPSGVENMYQRSIRGSGLAAPGKKKKAVPAKKPLAPFGRYTIDLQDLKDNKLALYTTKGNKQRRIPTSVVGGSVANVLKSIVVGKRPKPKDILTLDDTEKEYLAGIGMAAKIEDLEDMPTKKKTELQKELHEFEVIRGQIGAGNDNPELVKKFKSSLVKLVRAKKVNTKQANDILLELADLGH